MKNIATQPEISETQETVLQPALPTLVALPLAVVEAPVEGGDQLVAAEAAEAAKLAEAVAARAERAATLVRAGAVESLGDGRYRVRSGGGGWWAVRAGYCNCPDFAWRGRVPCKHIIAVELVRPLLDVA